MIDKMFGRLFFAFSLHFSNPKTASLSSVWSQRKQQHTTPGGPNVFGENKNRPMAAKFCQKCNPILILSKLNA
jgi:hypothetical protein